MPLTKKGSEIMSNMTKEYGNKKGKSVFYASANKGVIKGVHGSGPFSQSDIKKGFKVCYTASDLRALDSDVIDMKEGDFMARRRLPRKKDLS